MHKAGCILLEYKSLCIHTHRSFVLGYEHKLTYQNSKHCLSKRVMKANLILHQGFNLAYFQLHGGADFLWICRQRLMWSEEFPVFKISIHLSCGLQRWLAHYCI